tara:strand:- start:760 stop:930 length:171 start_codon:yes stop_codon:yes gene_type:complete
MFTFKPKGKPKQIDPRMIYTIEERFKPDYKEKNKNKIPKYYIDILPDALQSIFTKN